MGILLKRLWPSLVVGLICAGCANAPIASSPQRDSALSAGDRLIATFDDRGEIPMAINADCVIVLPLGVRINACGKTLDQIGEEICAAFKPDGPKKVLVRRVN